MAIICTDEYRLYKQYRKEIESACRLLGTADQIMASAICGLEDGDREVANAMLKATERLCKKAKELL